MVAVLDGDLGKLLVDLRRDAASKFLSVDQGNKDDDGDSRGEDGGDGMRVTGAYFFSRWVLDDHGMPDGIRKIRSEEGRRGRDCSYVFFLGRGWQTAGLRSEILSENGTCARPSPPSCPARKARATRHPCLAGTQLATDKRATEQVPSIHAA